MSPLPSSSEQPNYSHQCLIAAITRIWELFIRPIIFFGVIITIVVIVWTLVTLTALFIKFFKFVCCLL